MATDNKSYYCSKCNKTMGADQFYVSNNLEKYPDEGKMPQCKRCLTMHVDNWNPETYLWILQEIDVPYVPEEWNKLMAKYAIDRNKVTGMTILGRYLSKMKLKQFKDYRWEHTEFLQELANNKIEQTMKRQGYDPVQIAQAIEKASFEVPTGELKEPEYVQTTEYEDFFSPQQEEESPIELELTEEDKLALRIKWGKSYKPEEWVQLEKLFNDMTDSYDIQTAGHIDTLKFVCKTSLKANQLLDIGDVDGAQKMMKMYESMMKAGKFTAQQNKGESGEYVDSISELVAICETDGFIPRYYTDGPQDKVDRTLQDIQSYTRTLVTEEMNLGNLIENAVKQIEIDKLKEAERDADAADDEEAFEAELFDDAAEKFIDYKDYEEFGEFEDQLDSFNDDLFKKLMDGEL